MSATKHSSQAEGVSLSLAEVATVTGLTTYEVQCLHPEGFGSPGHFTMNRHGVVVYSERGLGLLADAIEVAPRPACKWRGMEAARWMRAAAHALRVEVESRRAVPCRALVVAAGEVPRREYWYQKEAF